MLRILSALNKGPANTLKPSLTTAFIISGYRQLAKSSHQHSVPKNICFQYISIVPNSHCDIYQTYCNNTALEQKKSIKKENRKTNNHYKIGQANLLSLEELYDDGVQGHDKWKVEIGDLPGYHLLLGAIFMKILLTLEALPRHSLSSPLPALMVKGNLLPAQC